MKNINNEEYIGRKYNDLTIISVLGLRNIGNGENRMFVRCVCDCGTVVECALMQWLLGDDYAHIQLLRQVRDAQGIWARLPFDWNLQ